MHTSIRVPPALNSDSGPPVPAWPMITVIKWRLTGRRFNGGRPRASKSHKSQTCSEECVELGSGCEARYNSCKAVWDTCTDWHLTNLDSSHILGRHNQDPAWIWQAWYWCEQLYPGDYQANQWTLMNRLWTTGELWFLCNRLGMSEVKGWYFPVKDTHAASITANQTICLPKRRSLLDGTRRNCYAELEVEMINKKRKLQTIGPELRCILYINEVFMRTKFTTQCGLFRVD